MEQQEQIQDQIPKITDDLKPKTDEEGVKRLVYFASHMRNLAREMMSNFWLAARSGKCGQEARSVILQGVSDYLYSNAVKEFCCVSIYLTMVDQSNPQILPWLLDFLKDSQLVVDKLIRGTSIKEIMQVHEHSRGYDIEKDSASYIGIMLGFRENPNAVIEAITALYKESKSKREDRLIASLSENIAIIDKQLSEINPK